MGVGNCAAKCSFDVGPTRPGGPRTHSRVAGSEAIDVQGGPGSMWRFDLHSVEGSWRPIGWILGRVAGAGGNSRSQGAPASTPEARDTHRAEDLGRLRARARRRG